MNAVTFGHMYVNSKEKVIIIIIDNYTKVIYYYLFFGINIHVTKVTVYCCSCRYVYAIGVSVTVYCHSCRYVCNFVWMVEYLCVSYLFWYNGLCAPVGQAHKRIYIIKWYLVAQDSWECVWRGEGPCVCVCGGRGGRVWRGEGGMCMCVEGTGGYQWGRCAWAKRGRCCPFEPLVCKGWC